MRHQKKEKRQRHSFTTIWTLLEREGFPYFTLSTLLSPLGKDVLSRPLTKHGKQGIYTHPLSFSSLIKDVMIDHIAQHRSQKIHLQNQAALRVEHLANLFSQSPILSVFWPFPVERIARCCIHLSTAINLDCQLKMTCRAEKHQLYHRRHCCIHL